MIEIKGIETLEGKIIDKQIPSQEKRVIDGKGLILFPALIDPHVHFRTPGLEHKEDWKTGSLAAIHGGITTVFDMPNTVPPTTTYERLLQKKEKIDRQLEEGKIPLRYGLYFGADKNHFEEIYKAKPHFVGLKIFMGASTGELLMDDESSLHAAFALAKAHDFVVAVHAEDEKRIKQQKALHTHLKTVDAHSKIRDRECARLAVEKALELASLYKVRLYILHVSTKEEIALIAQAKKSGVSVFAEVVPHHLFLTEEDYGKWGAKVQMNPPLRTQEDVACLWEAISKGIVDTIGSDHAPHTLEEKSQPYGSSPSGIPGVETTLPLLLNAHHEKKISLRQIVCLMRENINALFRIPPNDDFVLIDLKKEKRVDEKNLHSKCGWSPYHGRVLKGWPTFTILRGKVYEVG